ncbi:uncharacterized protein N7459_005782 [Penicillium hispanicum]|uniref:uncharacterized protein n=1 Tax=Penicillium hispanicum TaxID=1080232 RepID=UPI00253FDC5C|nr:uncharacterized protein N7459_005782 [Penicillium hispanicum]KAJ5579797.1 hypothetical protein N7459_005782 [Penicillium hispanicum]
MALADFADFDAEFSALRYRPRQLCSFSTPEPQPHKAMSCRSGPYRSRQKSCVACAEGKRRCNRQTPQCSRCLARGVRCSYVGVSMRPSKDASIPEPIDSYAWEQFSDLSAQSPQLSPLSSDPLSALGGPDWMTINPSLLTFPPSLSETLYPDVAFLDKWSTSQLLRSIKGFPRMFARHRSTPFIHPRLYETHLPDAIQDAFSVSASYCMKSAETEDTVFRILESKAAQLVRQDCQTLPLEDLLAAVQALMLFHTMQLFDGDIRQRSIAEQNLDVLRTWTLELHMRASTSGPAATWEAWVFSESVRRTVILATIIDDIYSVLKVGFCTSVPTLRILPFTATTGLWDASSSNSWLAESRRSGSRMVLYGDFSQDWREGQTGGKLDSFQKLLLTPCMGEKHRDILELEE